MSTIEQPSTPPAPGADAPRSPGQPESSATPERPTASGPTASDLAAVARATAAASAERSSRAGLFARQTRPAQPREVRDAAASPAGAPPATPAAPLTAEAFTDESLLGRERATARTGWRRRVATLTGGRVTPGPGAAERHHDALESRVRAPIEGTRRIVVMSRKGGVGKTTVTVGLGATFAQGRGDRVVAVDANPDAGNLARRIAGDCPRTITDLLSDADAIDTFGAMRRYTSQCDESRLEVLASDDDASISQALDRPAYRRVVSLLDVYYNLVLLDTGTGILDSANQGLIAEADQLVLVLRPALDGARAGAQTLDWLDAHGFGDLVSSAVVVVNAVTHPGEPAVMAITEHFSRRCAHVSHIPWDPALETGGRTLLSNLAPATREAFVDVAAAVADRFGVAVP
ncbi:MinD/ParA family protein [Intrasporangium sp. YIM S08009]|uniref:MinD/ParA family ATP-binding protein n=1 Tax=Intrasporangium zincisolvens TaxID=3080018 RepID=UPI002B05EE8A|nr:MinD/ParA family protein [Intrasporangium sp. YIM S08009]